MSTEFFPRGVLGRNPDSEVLLTSWFAKHLLSMNESPLWPTSGDEPLTLRFLGLPTWTRPMVVRVESRKDGWTLAAAATDGMGGYDAGKVVESTSRTLAPSEVTALQKLMHDSDFWNEPVDNGDMWLDGTTWVLEAIEAGRYHVVHREACVEPSTLAHRLCEFLQNASGLTGQ